MYTMRLYEKNCVVDKIIISLKKIEGSILWLVDLILVTGKSVDPSYLDMKPPVFINRRCLELLGLTYQGVTLYVSPLDLRYLQGPFLVFTVGN